MSDAADIMQTTAERLGRYLGVSRCAYAHVLEDRDTFDLIGDYNDGVESIVGRYRFTEFGEVVHSLMQEGRPYVNDDVDQHPSTRDADLAAYRATAIRAVICVPLLKEGRFVAAMAVHQSRPRRWSPDEVDLVATVVDRCWEALERLRETSERNAALQAAGESAEQFRVFAQALPNHVWTAPAEGALDWFNDTVYAYSGVLQGELDSDRWTSLVHPDDYPRASALWAASRASGEPYETEFRIRRADGEFRWHLVRALPLRSIDGRITRWIGTNTDVHESRLQHVEVTRERDRIWSLSQELMLVCDYAGVISAVNPAAMRILGWPNERMVGSVLSEFLHPDDLAATAAEMGKLSAGISTLAFENRYRTADGSYRLLSWTAVPESGAVHAVARDVSRERAAEEALRHSQKLEAIGQLTGGVAHDFNNELAVMRTSLDLLHRLPATDDRRPRFMDSISNSVTRATRLTSQLLAFARRQALQPSVFDAALQARQLNAMISSLTGERITIEFELPRQGCLVFADPNQFDTALVNLVANARDATVGAGRLVVRVFEADRLPGNSPDGEAAGPFVGISIADTGCGIAPEHLERIFEPFFTTKQAGRGTGLGLSQVFGFAKQSGGDIRVSSQPGRGTVFTLYLPRAGLQALPAPRPTEEEEPALGSGCCILVVEDNTEVSRSVQQTLQALDYVAVMTSTAEEALEELERGPHRFHAVFSDVVMPGMGGVELAREIRRSYPGMPVVLSSGYSSVLSEQSDHGFTLLPKPYSLQEIARVLGGAIEQNRAR